MKRRTAILGVLALIALVAGVFWWRADRSRTPIVVTLYGNVDLRQVDLPFYGNDRIAAVLAEEGDRVHSGDVLARLDTSRLIHEVAQAEANVAAQRAVVE